MNPETSIEGLPSADPIVPPINPVEVLVNTLADLITEKVYEKIINRQVLLPAMEQLVPEVAQRILSPEYLGQDHVVEAISATFRSQIEEAIEERFDRDFTSEVKDVVEDMNFEVTVRRY